MEYSVSKNKKRDWRESSGVKNTYCSSRGPEIGYNTDFGDSQPS